MEYVIQALAGAGGILVGLLFIELRYRRQRRRTWKDYQ